MQIIHKNLTQLISDLPVKNSVTGKLGLVSITGIQSDSRKIKPGDLFVALTGGSTDGHDHITAAVSKGAAAVVGTKSISDLQVPYIQVTDSREALAYLAASSYDHPGRKLTVIGVTGTDGKTTTSNMIYQILKSAGIRSGLISTVNAVIGEDVIDTGFHVTTPEAIEVQEYLARMIEAGLTHVVLETTSHGLAQHRVTGCEYDIAVFTNVTHEHLDYHGSYASYLEAKARLILEVEKTVTKPQGNPRLTVLNHDDSSFEPLAKITKSRMISYSTLQQGDLNAEEILHSPKGVKFTARGLGLDIPIECNLPGMFNVSNCLAAIGATVAGLGIDPKFAAQGIKSITGVPGRMEVIDLGQSFTAIVDFAHTPNALKRALETAREMTKGRVIAVFGSAGLRDREKRKLMAEVSLKLADITILTAEDPRTESLDAILEEMAKSAVKNGGVEEVNFFRVPDRGDAIRLGVKIAQPGDLVISCGKGHEQSMCFGTVEHPWDDRTALKAALAELLNKPGPKMPVLPTSTK